MNFIMLFPIAIMTTMFGAFEQVLRNKYEILVNIEKLTKCIERTNKDLIYKKCNEFLKKAAPTTFMSGFDWISEYMSGDTYKNSFTLRVKFNKESERLVKLNEEIVEFKNQFEECLDFGLKHASDLKICFNAYYIYIVNLSRDRFGHPNFFVDMKVFLRCCQNIRLVECKLSELFLSEIFQSYKHKCGGYECDNEPCSGTRIHFNEMFKLTETIQGWSNTIAKCVTLNLHYERLKRKRKTEF